MLLQNTTLKKIAERNLSIAELRAWLWIASVQNGRRRLFIAEIANALKINRSAANQAVVRLREQGLVETDSDPHASGKVFRVVTDSELWKPDERPQRRRRVQEPAA